MGLKRNVGLIEGLRYQGKGPMLTYILHRVGGLGIAIFVGLHILASFISNQAWGSSAGIFINSIYENWIFQIFIFFCALFHVINGLRIVILDFWPKLVEYQREAIWLEWLVFLPLYIISVIVIIRGGLGGEEQIMRSRTVSLFKRGYNFETFMWLFTRLSALAMYLCALIGLVGALIMGARTQMNMADLLRWTFMPDPNHVLLNTANNVLTPDAWMTLFWKVMGSIFVFFATSHGLHGVLSVIEDYNGISWLRAVLRILLLVLTVVMIGIGIYVIWTS